MLKTSLDDNREITAGELARRECWLLVCGPVLDEQKEPLSSMIDE